jgi:DNA-binding MarR family transcriptional regulator
MADEGKKDAVDEMVELLSELMTRGQAQGKVLDEFSRAGKGEIFILRYLFEKNVAVFPFEIAEALGSSTARVSTALGTLEKKGLVSREIDPANRRNILVTITDAGRERITAMMAQIYGRLRVVIMEMGLEDAGEFLRLAKRFFDIAARTMGDIGGCEI